MQENKNFPEQFSIVDKNFLFKFHFIKFLVKNYFLFFLFLFVFEGKKSYRAINITFSYFSLFENLFVIFSLHHMKEMKEFLL